MERLIKIILIILLILCLFKMPYGYYLLVRFIGMIGFAVLAYNSHKQNSKTLSYIYIALVILLQPFFKIALGREIWNVVDILIAIFLIYTLNKNKEK
jgi:hypothetical protein